MSAPEITAMPSKRNTGFSLIELLVVIAIVAILASIITVAVGRSRQTARRVACVSNLRQMGQALNLYAADNNGYFPAAKPATDSSGNTLSWPRTSWVYWIQPYLEARRGGTTATNLVLLYDGLFHCPAKPDWSLDGPTDRERNSYGMNTFGAANQGVPKKLNTIDAPAVTALLVDSVLGVVRTNAAIYQDNQVQWHEGKDNVLFVDGHVALVEPYGLDVNLVRTSSR